MNAQTTTITKLKPGESRSLEDRLDMIMLVADRIEKGESISSGQLMQVLNCSRDTAIVYRNAAYKLINEESKAWTRDTIRNVEIGRLLALQGRIVEKLNGLNKEDNIDAWYKVTGRLVDVTNQLHRITGLNSETTYNVNETRRVMIVRAEPKKVKAEVVQPIELQGVTHDVTHTTDQQM